MFLNHKDNYLTKCSFVLCRGLYDFRSSDVLCPVNIRASSGKEIIIHLIAAFRHSDCLHTVQQFGMNSEGHSANLLPAVVHIHY